MSIYTDTKHADDFEKLAKELTDDELNKMVKMYYDRHRAIIKEMEAAAELVRLGTVDRMKNDEPLYNPFGFVKKKSYWDAKEAEAHRISEIRKKLNTEVERRLGEYVKEES